MNKILTLLTVLLLSSFAFAGEMPGNKKIPGPVTITGTTSSVNSSTGNPLYLNNTNTERVILGDGLTVSDSILSQGSTSITFGTTGGTYNENLSFGFNETEADMISMFSLTGAWKLLVGVLNPFFSDNTTVNFGNTILSDFQVKMDTTGKDSFQMGVRCGDDDYAGYVSLMQREDLGHANRSPAYTSVDPVFRIWSSDETSKTDFLQFYHDQTDAIMKVGTGGDFKIGTNIIPFADNTYYLGRNNDDDPFAYRGVCLKDTTNQKYYRIEVINGIITATDLTD
jgi:hypothetical protein